MCQVAPFSHPPCAPGANCCYNAAMDLETLAWLRSPPGAALLAELAAQAIGDADVLPLISHLRQRYPPHYARAAIEQALLRQRARTRWPQADRLYFTREALEQATSAVVAHYRTRRFAGSPHVADVCCGIGGDMLALAAAHHQVTAIDYDAVRLALAHANAEALGLAGRITFIAADVRTTPPPPADALFCDPGRRSGGRRRFRVEQYEPPLAHVLRWRSHTPALAVKLAPGVALAELAALEAGHPCEVEFLSLAGELKEALLWCGPLATVRRRATVLQHTTADAPPATLEEAPERPTPPLAPPAQVLYEPDPAIIRSGLVAELATLLGAAQLDTTIAYLTAPHARSTPFARAWRILEWLPFSLKRLRTRLRHLEAGPVTVKKRGSPLDTDALARQLSGGGTRPLVVVLTHVAQRPAALICEQVPPHEMSAP